MKKKLILPIGVMILGMTCLVVMLIVGTSKDIVAEATDVDNIGSNIEVIEPTQTTQTEPTVKDIDYNEYLAQMWYLAGETNTCYSPVSLNTALQLHSCLLDNARAEMEILELTGGRDYLNYKQIDGVYTIANRIWVNKNKNIKLPEYLSEYVYEMDMSDILVANVVKNDWVKEVTNGFIHTTPSVLTDDTLVDVMNIVYFKDKWKDGDIVQESTPTIFHDITGSEQDTLMLQNSSDTYYETSEAYAVPLSYASGMKLYLIKPKKDLHGINLNNLLSDNSKKDAPAFVRFPEFDVYNELEPSNVLDELGLGTFAYADRIYTDEDDIQPEIIQANRIKVDKEGTEAAAVTEILDNKDAIAMVEDEPLDITLDEPFLFMVQDRNGDVAFIGKVVTLAE